MLRPDIRIKTINEAGKENNFRFCTELEVSTTWKKFTDTGNITIPSKVVRDGRAITIGENNVFKRGDRVEIDFGFYPRLQPLYSGYISKIMPEVPLKMEFQDVAWILKQTNVTFSISNCTLKQLIEKSIEEAKKTATGFILQELEKVTINVIDADLGQFRITNVNLVQVLDELKKTYALVSFFRGYELNVGFAYVFSNAKEYKFIYERDFIEDDKLEYIRADDVKIKVKATSMLPDNKKITVEVGDPHGETRCLFKYNLSESELKKVAEREKNKFKYEGWRGSFKTFLSFVPKHGDIADIECKRLPEKNGKYYIAGVKFEGGVNGYFMNIELGAKVSANIESF